MKTGSEKIDEALKWFAKTTFLIKNKMWNKKVATWLVRNNTHRTKQKTFHFFYDKLDLGYNCMFLT